MFCSYSLCEALAEQQKAAEEAEEAKLKANLTFLMLVLFVKRIPGMLKTRRIGLCRKQPKLG